MRRTTTPRRSIVGARRRRGGTTLTEVLMSLMVMGVGLVSVATLFPLSVLRSVQATRQTTATSLRYACEAFIDASYSVPRHFAATGATTPGCPSAAIALDPDGDGDPYVNDTNYVGGGYVYDNSDHYDGFYVVDPLGYWHIRNQSELHTTARYFGDWSGVGPPPLGFNRFSLNVPVPWTGVTPSPRLYGFTGTPESFTDPSPSSHIDDNLERARFLTGLPDSFTTLGDARISESMAAYTAAAPPALASVTFSSGSGADFSMFMTAGAADPNMLLRGQVTFISIDGRRSVVRKIDASTSTADLSGANLTLRLQQPLPTNFEAGGFDRVIVEAAEDRYTWMFTVRRQTGGWIVDVVVFFNRAFGRLDERVYVVGLDPATGDPDLKQCFVAWNSATDPRPELRRGGWMFDPFNFRWHKIGTILREEVGTLSSVPGADSGIFFRLEGAPFPSNETLSRGVFMRGVVDVYPLMPKLPEKDG